MTSLERDHVPSPRPITTKEVPLVNRTEEMTVLKEAVYRAVHGEGGLVFIHGEARALIVQRRLTVRRASNERHAQT